MNHDSLTAALLRADKLINWMSRHIGNMAPGDYGDCYRDLNEHGIFMHNLQVAKQPTSADQATSNAG